MFLIRIASFCGIVLIADLNTDNGLILGLQ